MKLENIIGHENIINSLKKSIEKNTVSHAYIFEGPKGVGKKTMAKVFANMLICEDNIHKPCHDCRGCVLFDSGNHPDVKIISPDINILVDQVRGVVKDVSIRPYYNKKIYIIENADKMTVQAQNSLLKTLEEPPGYAVIILTVENINALLPTIISRCVIKKFPRNTNNDVEKFIKINYGQNVENMKVVVSLSDGIIGIAKDIIESDGFNTIRRETFDVIKNLLFSSRIEILGNTKFFEKHKENIDLVLHLMLLWFRDMLILKQMGEIKFIINIDYKEQIEKFISDINSDKIDAAINSILEAKNNLSGNANFSLTIEAMLLKIGG